MVEDVTVFGHIAVRLERNNNLLVLAHSEADNLKKEWLRLLVIECIETEVVAHFQGMKN